MNTELRNLIEGSTPNYRDPSMKVAPLIPGGI